jgi:AcrR family transcriptional regulator
MPKRDALYMENQREMIARAALECIVESGLAGATTRDVCVRAGVSRGALYTHFKTREELILTAAELEPAPSYDPMDNWAEYEGWFRAMIERTATDDRNRALTLSAYELLAEMRRSDRHLPGVDANWDRSYNFLRLSLGAIHARGEIALPLGIEPTIQLHVQIYRGANHMLMGDRRLDVGQVCDGVATALAFTAGRAAAESGAAGQGRQKPGPAANTNAEAPASKA